MEPENERLDCSIQGTNEGQVVVNGEFHGMCSEICCVSHGFRLFNLLLIVELPEY